MIKFIHHNTLVFSRSIKVIMILGLLLSINNTAFAQQNDMIIRIAEIEIHPEHLEEYKTILEYEAEVSVKQEEGVIAIFPMFQKENPEQIRILEIYQNVHAYKAHLQTAHFLKYKNTTRSMVKTLKLLDMDALDLETAKFIFNKLKD